MKLDKQLFKQIAVMAAKSPRLRMHYDLRDSENEDGHACLMFCSKEPSQPFIVIPTHQKLLCVFMVQPLSVFMTSKVMKPKW